MMLLPARDNNIQSFSYIWLHKGNQNEFLKHPKIQRAKRAMDRQSRGWGFESPV